MKTCPNCQREFPDTMRFCQTDGTPLPDAVEPPPPDDPLKTTVVRQDEIAAMIPPDDPFRTMIASRVEDRTEEKEDEEDVLQLPDDFDPMATMVVAPITAPEKPSLEELVPDLSAAAFDSIKEEIQPEAPPNTFETPSAPPVNEPPPPVFNEPIVEAPSFSAPSPSASAAEDDDIPATVFQSHFDNVSAPAVPAEPEIPSPFSAPPPTFNQPVNEPVASWESEPLPPPVSEALPPPAQQFQPTPFQPPPSDPVPAPAEPVPAFAPTPFDAPSSPFESPSSPFAPEPSANQAFQPAEWNPPPTPVGEWGNQGIGANTPFQPPAVAGQSKVLAIISLVTGLLGFLTSFGSIIPLLSLACIPGSFLFGVAGIITGFLARGRANKDPEQYGGKGLALGGIILGALGILIVVGLFVLFFGLAFLANRG